MKLLITGGRDFADYDAMCRALSMLSGIEIIIQGGARGADNLAARYAAEKGIHCATVPACWDRFGKRAGHLRNAAMLLLGPTYCTAFPGGRGTAGMVAMCERKQIPVWRPYG